MQECIARVRLGRRARFLAIHRKGSLSAAARLLGVNQSTVGRRLLTLEEQLGTRLFIRTRDGYLMAPPGARLLPHAERMEDEVTAIAREITGQVTSLAGTVRVTAPDLFGARVIAPMLARFHERYPDIDLELDASPAMRSLSKREADMAVRLGGTRESGLAVRKVGEVRNVVYASRDYLARRGRPRGGDWSGHDFVSFSDQQLRIPESRWIEEHAAKGRVVMRTNSTAAQISAAVAVIGIVLVPCYAGDAELNLVRLATPQKAASPICLVTHHDTRHAARIRACSDFLADGIRGMAGAPRGTRAVGRRS